MATSPATRGAKRRSVPLWLVARLALAIVLDTAVHITLKLGADRLPGALSAQALLQLAHEPLFLVVAVVLAASATATAQTWVGS